MLLGYFKCFTRRIEFNLNELDPMVLDKQNQLILPISPNNVINHVRIRGECFYYREVSLLNNLYISQVLRAYNVVILHYHLYNRSLHLLLCENTKSSLLIQLNQEITKSQKQYSPCLKITRQILVVGIKLTSKS